MNDPIERQAAIDAADRADYTGLAIEDVKKVTDEVVKEIKKLPSTQPESTRTFVKLVVKYLDPEVCTYKEYKGKPYYSIKYIENGETHVGYGTYNPEVLSQYLKEYFILSAQPEIIYCENCKHREREGEPVADGRYWCELHNTFMYYCSEAERRTDEGD